ncbi:plasmid recombination protein [Sphingomonas melonis]|uniref:plasmid recombination protein n=1 Tax=Sphingomonas melonis TaxID=152682 RepID=UPI0003A4818A|nr:plasmid recombination protein [Sphingomonas melonis]
MPANFAIITFRNTGPIKTWSAMRATNVHNARTKPLAHAIAGAPPPEHMIGTGDLVADVQRHLRGVKIDPDRLRKNGVIAYEAILSASAEFFDEGTAQERAGRLTAWKAAQREWALKRYGAHRVASMVLHVDEKVPHIHLVIVPLEVKTDKRRTDRELRWGLVGRGISGPGKFDEVQDAYAAAMASFGLVRGVRGSGRKHEPVPVYLARMAAKEQAVDDDRADARRDRARVDAERAEVEAHRLDVERRELELAERAERLDREDAARRRRLDQEREVWLFSIDVDRREVEARERDVASAEKRIATDQANLASNQANFERFRDDLLATRERLLPIAKAAKAFVRAAAGMRPEDVVPTARPAVAAARHVVEACRPAPPAHMIDAIQHAAMAAAGAGR